MSDPGALTVLTWNLNGLEDRHLDVRTEAACMHVLSRPDPPDIVAVQEVVERTWRAHLLPHFGHAGYVALPGRAESEYWCALFVRSPVVAHSGGLSPLPQSDQGRTLLEAELEWAGQPLWVATAHLESLAPGARAREAQLHHVFDRMLQYPRSIFLGDTNLREAEAARVVGGREWAPVDAWEAVGRAANKATWRRGRTAMRLDRVYLRGLQASGLRLVGELAVGEAGGARPSDHLGVEVRLGVEG